MPFRERALNRIVWARERRRSADIFPALRITAGHCFQRWCLASLWRAKRRCGLISSCLSPLQVGTRWAVNYNKTRLIAASEDRRSPLTKCPLCQQPLVLLGWREADPRAASSGTPAACVRLDMMRLRPSRWRPHDYTSVSENPRSVRTLQHNVFTLEEFVRKSVLGLRWREVRGEVAEGKTQRALHN